MAYWQRELLTRSSTWHERVQAAAAKQVRCLLSVEGCVKTCGWPRAGTWAAASACASTADTPPPHTWRADQLAILPDVLVRLPGGGCQVKAKAVGRALQITQHICRGEDRGDTLACDVEPGFGAGKCAASDVGL